MSIPSVRITAPRPPDSPAPFRFPLIAATAPVVIAVAIWLITGSMFALLFAALGPVTALASYIDSRWGGRRTQRRELARFEGEVALATQRISDAQAHEVSAIAEVTPDAATIVERRGADPYRWGHAAEGPVVLSLGYGIRRSEVQLETIPAATHQNVHVADGLARLVDLASTIHAPLVADARGGIALCGPAPTTAALARAFVVQLAWALAPDCYWYRRQETNEFEWMADLPHAEVLDVPDRGAIVDFGLVGHSEPCVSLVVAQNQSHLSAGFRVVISVDADGESRIVEHPDRSVRQPITVAALSREDAAMWAAQVSRDATAVGRVGRAGELPDRIELAALLTRATTQGGLSAPVGLGPDGDVVIDLVAHGPHAIVGGTTGSGKSELLIAWVLAMAAMHSPQVVNFLLVDFKGGAAFLPLEALPHTVGTITDLDEHTARRALESLRAELRFRERQLALSGARSIADHDSMARLVIVVDEFQAMLADHPELQTLFADIAARGRSLGVHLILCTQRPGGVVRDGVLANADLRISLRVNNSADSAAVIGTDDAAAIPAAARGRAVVRMAGESVAPVQFAIADAALGDAVRQRWSGEPEPRRPWCEPLPTRILVRDLDPLSPGVVLGVTDLPQEQRRDMALWDEASGHLLVAGGPRSGKTAALATIATGAAHSTVLPADPALAWELIARLVENPEPMTLVIDDLDALLAKFSGDYRAEFVERLIRVVREGPSWGVSCAVSVSRVGAELVAMAALFSHRLMLSYPSRNEHVLAGGDGAQFRADLPAGGGTWKGAQIQVALAGHPLVPARLGPPADVPGGPLAIVSGRSSLVARAYAADPANQLIPLGRETVEEMAGALGRAIVVADVDEWQANWGALAALRSRATVVIHSCSPAEFRALTRARELPPLLASGDPAACWVLDDEGKPIRGSLELLAR